MPLVDYRCHGCGKVTERLIRGQDIPASVPCDRCGSKETMKLVSPFHARIYRKPKYSEEFVEKSLPFLKSEKGIGQAFEEGKEWDEARAMKISEAVGDQIDEVLQTNWPTQ